MIAGVLFGVGVFLLLGVTVLLVVRGKRIALRWRLGRVPMGTAATLQSGSPVRLRGVATPRASGAGGGSGQSPVTGEATVLERVTIRRCDENGDSVLVEDVVIGSTFVLQGSAGAVSIAPEASELAISVTHAFQQQAFPQVVGEGRNQPPTALVLAWVLARGYRIELNDLRVVVRSIRAGDEIVAAGTVSGGVLAGAPGKRLLVASPRALEGAWDLWMIGFLIAGSLATLIVAAGFFVLDIVSSFG